MEKSKSISRRKFIDLTVQSSAAIGLTGSLSLPLLQSGCSSPVNTRTVLGACYHDCPDACSWKVTLEGDKVVGFGANEANAFTGKSLCSKMDQFPNDVTFHPDRILTPLKRTGEKGSGKFEEISWDQALAEVSEKLNSVINQYGSQSVLPYGYAGTEGLVQLGCMSNRFFARLGASKLDGTICGDTAAAGTSLTYGQTTGMLPEDIVHSRFIIIWGTNTKNTNVHLWDLIQQARANGAKVVVIDPFLSSTAQEADWHVQPMPGTDTALALSMIQVILEDQLQDNDYISKYTVGIEELREHVKEYTPEKVTDLMGINAHDIRKLAREYATESPSCIRVLIGMEHQANGASAFRTISMLPSIIGSWKKLGGGMSGFTYELFGDALNWSSVSLGNKIWDAEARVINMVQIGKALNDPALNPRIHSLFVYNSNPAVIAPNQNEVIRGLKRDDLFTVVLEHFMTDTARYADYIFPATTQLEHWDLISSWGSTHLNLNQPAINPRGQSLPNSEIFRLLAKEMGFEDEYFNETDLEIIKNTLDKEHPYLQGITFDSLMETGFARLNLPEPWLPFAVGNFKTPSGKCEFYNADVEPSLPEYVPFDHGTAKEQFPLRLLTIKSTKNFLNSSHANVKHLQDKEGIPKVDMHPTDAQDRQINEGDKVRLFNQYGELTIQARVSDRVRKGVVCVPQGFWSSLVEGGSSANALTTDALSDMGGGGAFQESIVQAEKLSV